MAGTMETRVTNAHSSYGLKQSLHFDLFSYVISEEERQNCYIAFSLMPAHDLNIGNSCSEQ